MSLVDVPADRRCNAKTRTGEPCRNWSILPAGRCRMHGGKSYRGIAAPAYRHGWYSKDILCNIWRREWEYQERMRRRVEKRLAELDGNR